MAKTRIYVTIFSAFIFLVYPTSASIAQQADAGSRRAREILRQIDDMWRGISSHATVTMQVKTAHYTRTMRLEAWSP